MPVRTFIALELSDAQKDGILGLIERLRSEGLRASWSRRATIHLTLKFLGDVEEESLQDVVEATGRAASRVGPFGVSLGGAGAFPSARRPRVLWLGVEADRALFDLQGALEEELSELGFERERRRFKPHVTLGRIREQPSGSIEALLDSLEIPEGRTVVDSVRVMRSKLSPGGAVHDVVQEIPLGS